MSSSYMSHLFGVFNWKQPRVVKLFLATYAGETNSFRFPNKHDWENLGNRRVPLPIDPVLSHSVEDCEFILASNGFFSAKRYDPDVEFAESEFASYEGGGYHLHHYATGHSNKVVINACYGGFNLSEKAEKWLTDRGVSLDDLERHNPLLVKCVETLGEGAGGECSKLKIVEINNNKYRIVEYDGWESVETPDSIEWITI